jgi:hypothetical protein
MIYLPINQVFDFVSRHENDFQWQYGTLATASLSDGFSDMGTLFRSIGHLMGRRNLSTFEVTEYEPNKRYGFKSRSGPFELQTRYVFEMKDRCTQIDISTQIKVVDFFRVDEGVLEKRLNKQLKENLAMLKDVLEIKRIPLVN